MYVFPNTDIYFLTDVNLNNDYDHTIFFQTAAPPADPRSYQTTYFMGKRKFTLTNQSYQRKERGWLKVEVPQNSLWDCTYMMYRNTSYGDKWFYAFILSTEYVNDVTTLVNFEIDVIQTWFFDWTFEKCFVEREHSTTDELFENTIPENLEMGEEYTAQIRRKYDLTSDAVVMVVSSDENNLPITPTIQGNIISGLRYITCRKNDYSQIISLINDFISGGIENNIITMFQVPEFLTRLTPLATAIDDYYEDPYSFTPNFVNIDGYIPKNKKLFTYPYNFMQISDISGNKINLKWEYWDSTHIGEMNVRGCIFGKPTIITYPKYYRDIPDDIENGITFDKFPVVTWVGDSYQLWLAQNRPSILANALQTGVETIAHGNGLRPITSLFSIIANDLQASRLPQTAHGTPNSEVISTQTNTLGFYYTQYTVRNEYARIIDEFFSKFGYATHRVKIPNLNARQKWTYTKTAGCEINGNIPSDDLVKIKTIFDKGVTFWTNGDNIGNYGDFSNPVYTP